MKKVVLLIKTLVQMVALSLMVSAVLCFVQWLLSLTGICNTPTWNKFWWGAAGVFMFYFLFCIWKVITYFVGRK